MLLFGIGAVLAFEGLVLALMPGRLEEVLAFLSRLPVERRRGLGLGALALGVVVIWLARRMGA
ncbi:MAG: DUF2065 family protein [Paracoccaceae bacterium]|nr:DUF2065 family protein [Paracoccaceae bacterium]MDE3120865.1 DUF2065 family protein [Paracoccaceae bacterium]MDE3240587.1 DUF2065 family protein [Paracoccaceae bacterium]